jgi:hypothetical protein
MLANIEETLVPIVPMAAMAAMEMTDAMAAYSMLLVPAQLRRRL